MCNGYYAPMRVFFYIGLVFLVSSFLAAAAENASHAIVGAPRSFILPAYDLWYTLWPKSLLVIELKVERLFGAWMWDPVLLTLLQLPAWLILGAPGVTLVVFFRPNRGESSEEEMAGAVESLDLYNELTRLAKEENPPGEEHGPHDIMPENAMTEGEPLDPIRPNEFIEGTNPFAGGSDKS
ncbi:MAG: hypothetical protein ISR45_11995 [Rhodospirillales bacterium]|nr:hypothetical protein [Rhodospirillales bacterium]